MANNLQIRSDVRKQLAQEIYLKLEKGTWLESALVETLAQKFGGYQELTATVLRQGERLGLFERETTKDGGNTGRWQLGTLLVGSEPLQCCIKSCSYFNHYLTYGAAELTHEGFHAAEKHCEEAQKRVIQWYEDHKEGNPPEQLEQLCRSWEARIRA